MYRSRPTKGFALARYFTVLGVVLVGGLIGASALLGPGGPGPSLVKGQLKVRSARTGQNVTSERPRDEVPSQRLAAQVVTSATPPKVVVPTAPAPSAQTPTFTALVGLPTPEEAARATRIAQEKIAAEKARKRRLAREHARAQAIAAARRQDQQSFGQFTTPDYAYAPRQSYGPFRRGQNNWGHGWQDGWSNWGNGSTSRRAQW